MDTNMTFRMDSEVKAQMSAICAQLGMTTSTAFNIFANAFCAGERDAVSRDCSGAIHASDPREDAVGYGTVLD